MSKKKFMNMEYWYKGNSLGRFWDCHRSARYRCEKLERENGFESNSVEYKPLIEN